MSCKTSNIYGYGFKIPDYTDDDFRKFILNHAETIKKHNNNAEMELLKLAEDKTKNFDIDTIEETDAALIECDITRQEGCDAIISNIIARETSIRTQYEPGDGECESDPSILFPETYPWYLNETEKALTEKSLQKILYKYLKELDSRASIKDIEYLDIEYFG